MKKPDLLDKFMWEGQQISVQWFDILDGKIPDISPAKWQTVKIFANENGKLVLCYNPENSGGSYEVPGGHYEDDDHDIETTFFREFAEETNGEIISWQPIGYQICTNKSGHSDYQLRVFANVKNTSRHINDPGGGITRTELVPLADFTKYIDWGLAGARMLSLIKDKF